MIFGGAVRKVLVSYFVDHDPDHRRATLVSGMGRSGTTWLAELLNYRNDHRLIFEPFDAQRVALAVNFKDHQYLRADDDDPCYLAPARAIVTGLLRDPFADQHNRRLVCGRRIIKEVRANLILKWLFAQFPGMPIVLIVRHPFAVAMSRMAVDADIDLQAEFLSQPALAADFLEPFRDVVRLCSTPFDRSIAAWCIEVGVPLSQFHDGDISVVFYEHLCTRPAETLKPLFHRIGRPFGRGVLHILRRPSQTTFEHGRLAMDWKAGPVHLARSWRHRISGRQIARGLELLAAFGLDHLYGEDAMPLVESAPMGRGLRLARSAKTHTLMAGPTRGAALQPAPFAAEVGNFSEPAATFHGLVRCADEPIGDSTHSRWDYLHGAD